MHENLSPVGIEIMLRIKINREEISSGVFRIQDYGEENAKITLELDNRTLNNVIIANCKEEKIMGIDLDENVMVAVKLNGFDLQEVIQMYNVDISGEDLK